MSTQSEALRLAQLLRTNEGRYLIRRDEAATELQRMHALNQELLEALCNALPYVEDVLANKEQRACFKPGVVQAHAQAIRAAIAKVEGQL